MPRKTLAHDGAVGTGHVASMRPRPDAAENAVARTRHAGDARASMRPRPDAAENAVGRGLAVRGARASMRPRPDAAENTHADPRDGPPLLAASMRPRPDAAENPSRPAVALPARVLQ